MGFNFVHKLIESKCNKRRLH